MKKLLSIGMLTVCALALMERHKIFVLFALDKAGVPQGVIHMHHIVEGKIV